MGIPVTLIPGDGIGPSIAEATVRVLEASGAPIEWDVQLAGLAALMRHHDPMPEATLESIRRTRVALKGPLETPIGEGYRSVNVALRTTFDLYANVRPAHVVVRGGRFDKVDIVLVRENTEGLYVGFEHYIKIGDDPRAAAESLALITRAGSERVIRYAFEYARLHQRHKGHARPQGEHPEVLAGAVSGSRAPDRGRVRAARHRVRGQDRRRDGDEPRACAPSSTT